MVVKTDRNLKKKTLSARVKIKRSSKPARKDIRIPPAKKSASSSKIKKSLLPEGVISKDELAAMAHDWQTTFDASNDGIWLIDKDQRVVRANRMAEKMFGQNSGSCVGRHCYEIVHGTKKPIPGCPVERSRTSLRRESMDLQVGERWYLVTADPILDQAGRFSGMVHVVSDITERKRLESALRSEKAFIDIILNAQQDTVIITDTMGRFVYLNNRAVEISGYERDELLRMNVAQVHPPDQHDKIRCAIEELMKSGHSKLETDVLTKDGRRLPHEFNISVIRDDHGSPKNFCSVGRDLTERKKAEDALREHEQIISAIAESSKDWIWAIDRNARHTYSNKAIESILGYSLAECHEMGLELMHPDDRRLVEAEWPGLVDERRGWRNKVLRWRTKDGRYRYLESTAGPILDPQGELLGFRGVDRDITERKQAEESIKAAHSRLQATLDALPDLLFEVDAEGRIFSYHAHRSNLLAVPPEVFMGKRIADVLPPDVASTCQRAIDEIAQNGFSTGLTYRLALPQGECWFEISAAPMDAAAQPDQRFIMICRDITERKKAEEALKESNERFRALFDSSPDPVWIIDNQRFVECNQAAVEMLGYPDKDSLRNIHPSGLSPKFQPDGENSYSKAERMMLIAREKGINRFEWVHRRRDQSDFFAEVTLSAITLQGRQVLYCIWRDITMRKRAEEGLKAQQYFLAKAQEMGHIGTWELDTINNILVWTDESYRLFGIPIGTPLTLETFVNCVHPDDREYVDQAWKAALNHKPYDIEHRIILNNSIKWIREKAELEFDDHGKCVRAIGFTQDITERKKAEDEIRRLNAELELRVSRRTAQLEAANKELESFSYSVSHDLRAPLRGIDGWSLALKEDYEGKLDEQAQTYIGRIRAETQRMGQLIDALLQLSRTARATVSIRNVDLSTLAADIAARLNEAKNERQVEFVIQPRIKAYGDPYLLELVLTNLLGNAFKFTGKCEKAKIEFGVEKQGAERIAQGAGRGEAQSRAKREKVYFVRDNGAGFDMEYSKKLFGAFQRMHMTDEFPGTGIGLATVQRIILRHGGRIWAEAEVDKGATFYFTLGVETNET